MAAIVVRPLHRQPRGPESRPPAQGGIWEVPQRFNFTRDVVEATAATDPFRRALTFADREGIIQRLTYAEVAIQAARWAALLRARGLAPGDRVLVVIGSTPAWQAVLLGALKAGCVAVPCSELLRPRDLAFRGGHADARLVIVDRERAAGFAAIEMPVELVVVEDVEDELRRFPHTQPTHDSTSDEIAFILYTSGTSGEPKGALHTHAYTWTSRFQAQHWLDVRRGDLVWCTSGPGSVKSIWNSLLGPWSCGAEVAVHDGPFDPEERVSLISALGVTVLCQPPTEYRLIAKLDHLERLGIGRVRHAAATGEPLNPDVIAAFHERLGVTIHDGYGQAENTVLVANTRGIPVKPGSMGLPTPGHHIAVVDEEGNEAPVGVEGEIALRGSPPSLFRGYWNAPEETNAVFLEDWYLTGDRSTRDADGYLWFAGRSDDVILSAAHRVGPAEVESALLEHEAVAESAVIGRPDPDSGEIVKAFIVLEPGFEPSADLARELQDYAMEVTAPFSCPRLVEFVPELPKTASGKLRRVELRDRERISAARQAKAELLEAQRAIEAARAEEQWRAEESRRRLEQLRAEEIERQQRAHEAAEAAKAAEAAAEARKEAARRRRAERTAEKKQRLEEERRVAEAAEAAAIKRREAAARRRAQRKAEKEQRAGEGTAPPEAPAASRQTKKKDAGEQPQRATAKKHKRARKRAAGEATADPTSDQHMPEAQAGSRGAEGSRGPAELVANLLESHVPVSDPGGSSQARHRSPG